MTAAPHPTVSVGVDPTMDLEGPKARPVGVCASQCWTPPAEGLGMPGQGYRKSAGQQPDKNPSPGARRPAEARCRFTNERFWDAGAEHLCWASSASTSRDRNQRLGRRRSDEFCNRRWPSLGVRTCLDPGTGRSTGARRPPSSRLRADLRRQGVGPARAPARPRRSPRAAATRRRAGRLASRPPGRSLKHLIEVANDLAELGIVLVVCER